MTQSSATPRDAKRALTPKLRFPEFRDSAEWKPVSLGDASVPVDERVGERKLTPVSISAGIGFVPQAEKFGRDISGNQYKLYTVVRDGDFVYNKGNSLRFPQGCIYQLHNWGEVAAPNVFICFRLKKGYSDGFFQSCFEKSAHGIQLKRHITSGARSNGLLNISRDTFFGVEIPTPALPEQQKIAECLSTLDELIGAESQKLDALKAHKKGLMQQLFPREGETLPRLRFPEFSGQWNVTQLERLCEGIYSGRDRNDSEGEFDLYGSTGIIGKTAVPSHSGQHILVARVGANAGLLNMAFGKFGVTDNTLVLSPKASTHIDFIFHYLGSIKLNRFIFGSGQPLITGSILKDLPVLIPTVSEQRKISDCLSSLDKLIAAQGERVAILTNHKQGLLQQLFPVPEAHE